MNTNIQGDFQICISVPLITFNAVHLTFRKTGNYFLTCQKHCSKEKKNEMEIIFLQAQNIKILQAESI